MRLFDGLESFGFTKAELTVEDLYRHGEAAKKNQGEGGPQNRQTAIRDNPMDYLYAKELDCPVCDKNFVTYITRKSRLRLKNMELDLKPNYHFINANCYDVYLCPHCGYAALSAYFNRISEKQKEIILSKITPRYKNKKYDIPLSLEDAVVRYKLALFCALAIGANAGQKAILCVKTAWVYRDLKDKENELLFLRNACVGLQEAYGSESFPIGAMDEQTVMYMVGELYRRTGDFSNALRWISGVIVSRSTQKKLKERAVESKELIRAKVST